MYANGRVYWTNGVYDKVYFDSSLVNARPKLSSSATIEVTDEFEWAEYSVTMIQFMPLYMRMQILIWYVHGVAI